MDHLDNILKEYIQEESLDEFSRLSDYNIDSLDCYTLQGKIEDSYNITLSDADRIYPGRRIQEIRLIVNRYS